MRLGATEILLILAIALLVFGSSKVAGLGKALGTSIREFKQEMKTPDASDPKVGDGNGSEPAPKQ